MHNYAKKLLLHVCNIIDTCTYGGLSLCAHTFLPEFLSCWQCMDVPESRRERKRVWLVGPTLQLSSESVSQFQCCEVVPGYSDTAASVQTQCQHPGVCQWQHSVPERRREVYAGDWRGWGYECRQVHTCIIQCIYMYMCCCTQGVLYIPASIAGFLNYILHVYMYMHVCIACSKQILTNLTHLHIFNTIY